MVAVAAALASIALASGALYFALPTFTPWREMAELIESRIEPGEEVVAVSPQVLATPLAHYYRGEIRYSGEEAVLPDATALGVWIYFRDGNDEVVARAVPAHAQRAFERVEAFRFSRGRVVHLRERSAAP